MSSSTTVPLTSGDQVEVMINNGTGVNFTTQPNNFFSYFAGFQIY
jgi:hypothetical protein